VGRGAGQRREERSLETPHDDREIAIIH
jgi:hypothetical protein